MDEVGLRKLNKPNKLNSIMGSYSFEMFQCSNVYEYLSLEQTSSEENWCYVHSVDRGMNEQHHIDVGGSLRGEKNISPLFMSSSLCSILLSFGWK